MTDKIFNIENVSLDEIKVTQASLENELISNDSLDIKSLEISYGFDVGMNIDHNLVKMTFWCKISTPLNKEDSKASINGHFNIDFFYKVPGLEELTHRSGGQAFIQSDVLVSLANITYSTARGIIYNRSLGTLLDKFILPILPTQKLHKFFL